MATTNIFNKLNFHVEEEDEVKVAVESAQPKDTKKKRKVRQTDQKVDENDDDFQDVQFGKKKAKNVQESEPVRTEKRKPDENKTHKVDKNHRQNADNARQTGESNKEHNARPRHFDDQVNSTDHRGKNRMDKQSRTGYDKSVKKGGAGGRGTWGNVKSEAHAVQKHENLDHLYTVDTSNVGKRTEEETEKVEEKVEEPEVNVEEVKVEDTTPKVETITLEDYKRLNNVADLKAGDDARLAVPTHKGKGKAVKVGKNAEGDSKPTALLDGLNLQVKEQEPQRRDYKNRNHENDNHRNNNKQNKKKFKMNTEEFPEL